MFLFNAKQIYEGGVYLKRLLKEYRETLKKTKRILEKTMRQIEIAKAKNEHEKVKSLEEEARIFRSEISDLSYTIKWIRTGGQPDRTRGIENRAAYDREVSVDPYWIQLNSNGSEEIIIDDESEKAILDKERLLKEITKPLNKTEKEILIMSANSMSIRNISNMTGIPRSTVHDVLEKCKRKIEKEGWLLV